MVVAAEHWDLSFSDLSHSCPECLQEVHLGLAEAAASHPYRHQQAQQELVVHPGAEAEAGAEEHHRSLLEEEEGAAAAAQQYRSLLEEEGVVAAAQQCR